MALFQFFLGCLLAPLNSLPFLQDAYIPIGELATTISNGGKCMAGIDTIVNSTVITDGIAHASCWMTTKGEYGAPNDVHCDNCHMAWLPIFGYVFFNCFYNLFMYAASDRDNMHAPRAHHTRMASSWNHG